ncbi:MAG: rhamnogalacturonan lyase [Bacteroides sp.]|nr:rhamnogalacturonan lyase [Bacteroides sp.]
MKFRSVLLSLLFLPGSYMYISGQQPADPGTGYTADLLKEKPNRGIIAIHEGEGTVTISWRLHKKDPADIAFDLYRTLAGGEKIKINKKPITLSTYIKEKNVDTTTDQLYTLTLAGEEETIGEYQLTTKRAATPYLSIPIEPLPFDTLALYQPNDISIGDLDGDGEIEIVLKRVGAFYACSQPGISPGGVIIEAYKLDGRRMWQVDLGPNIRQGAQYLQFLVYDFDGDGKAEVALKTSEGTRFGDGKIIGDTDGDGITDYVIRDPTLRTYGKILSGPEFFSILDGETGAERVRGPYIERGRSEDWGDDYGNRVDRQLGAIGYFDGLNPCIFWGRGYNGRSVMHAWRYTNGELEQLWSVDTNEDPYHQYANQGNHNISIGDVDGDGKDEVMYGACAIDHDGSPLYTTRLGHGDAMHLTDIDPSRPGLEVWQGHEYAPGGSTLRDAATGEILFQIPADGDVGRALTADIDPRYPGLEIWTTHTGGVYSSKGEPVSKQTPSINMAVWWDGDLSRELLDGIRIDKWNGFGVTNLFDGSNSGIASNNGTKKNPCLVADILGDWREEVIWRSEKNDEIRIYLTPYPTTYRFPTFLEDPVYRLSVAHQNVGYNQPTQAGFYFGTDYDPRMKEHFQKMDSNRWKEKLVEQGTEEWQKNWFLDGKRALVKTTDQGIWFEAGPTLASDADHSVLWTRQSFTGDIKIEYDFTRTDSLDRFVNIIYIQAQGSGEEGYDQDIALWNDKREIPAMKTYFNHMNTLHISYAAYENDPDQQNPDYIRGRRYMPASKKGLANTELWPEYLSPLLFETGKTYHITIIKRQTEIIMKVEYRGKERYFYFSAEDFPPIESGRVGLRQMSGRKSHYTNLKIYTD